MPAHKKPMNREILYKMFEDEPYGTRYSSREIAEFLGCYKGTSRKWLLDLKKQGIVNETGVTNNPLKPLSRDESPNAASNKNEWFLTAAGTRIIMDELYGKLTQVDEEEEEEWFFFMKDLYYKQTDYDVPEKSMKYLEYLNLVQDYGDGTFELLGDGVDYVESVMDDNCDNTDTTAREVLYEMYKIDEYKTTVEIAYFLQFIIPAAQELITEWVDEGILEDCDDEWTLTGQGCDKIVSEIFDGLYAEDPEFLKYLQYLRTGKEPYEATWRCREYLKYLGDIVCEDGKWIITQDGRDFVRESECGGQPADKIEIRDLPDDSIHYLLRVLYEQPIEDFPEIQDYLLDHDLLDIDVEDTNVIHNDGVVDALDEYINEMIEKYKGMELLYALVASPKDVKYVSWHWDEKIVNIYIAMGFIQRISDVLHITDEGNPNNPNNWE